MAVTYSSGDNNEPKIVSLNLSTQITKIQSTRVPTFKKRIL